MAKPRKIAVSGRLGSFARLPNGRLFSVYSVGKKLKDWRDPRPSQIVFGRVSTDSGRSWGRSWQLFTFPPGEGSISDPLVLVTADGQVHLFGLRFFETWGAQNLSDWRSELWHTSSPNHEGSWPTPVAIDYGHRYTGALNSVIQLKSGRILLPFSYLSDRATGRFVADTIFSDDGAKTWQNAKNDIPLDTGGTATESGAVEPVVVERDDTNVWMLIRTQAGRLFECFSHDGGESWSGPQPSVFRSSNAPAALHRFPDGRLAVAWNNAVGEPMWHGTSYARQSLVVAISENGGASWEGTREIARLSPEDDPNLMVCYPWLMDTAEGSLLAGFVKVDARRWEETVQYNLVDVDPLWLKGNAASETFSRGLDDWTLAGTMGTSILRYPDAQGSRALRLQKPNPDRPSGMTWNFPFAFQGRLTLELRWDQGFQGAFVMLSESFLSPWNLQGGLFRLLIRPDGRLATQYENRGTLIDLAGPSNALVMITAGERHDFSFEWNCYHRQTTLTVDHAPIGVLPQLEEGRGLSYLRLSSTAQSLETSGLWVNRVTMEKL